MATTSPPPTVIHVATEVGRIRVWRTTEQGRIEGCFEQSAGDNRTWLVEVLDANLSSPRTPAQSSPRTNSGRKGKIPEKFNKNAVRILVVLLALGFKRSQQEESSGISSEDFVVHSNHDIFRKENKYITQQLTEFLGPNPTFVQVIKSKKKDHPLHPDHRTPAIFNLASNVILEVHAGSAEDPLWLPPGGTEPKDAIQAAIKWLDDYAPWAIAQGRKAEGPGSAAPGPSAFPATISGSERPPERPSSGHSPSEGDDGPEANQAGRPRGASPPEAPAPPTQGNGAGQPAGTAPGLRDGEGGNAGGGALAPPEQGPPPAPSSSAQSTALRGAADPESRLASGRPAWDAGRAQVSGRRGTFYRTLPSREDLPENLRAIPDFVGREKEIAKLDELLIPNGVISVYGPPLVGKTELVAAYVERRILTQPTNGKFKSPFSLLVLQPEQGMGKNGVLRSLEKALEDELGRPDAFSSANPQEDDPPKDWIEHFCSLLWSQIGNRSLLVIVDRGVDGTTNDQALSRLLGQRIFKFGAAIVISREKFVPEQTEPAGKSIPRTLGRLKPLGEQEATALLVSRVLDEELCALAVLKLRDIPEALFPYCLALGGGAFSPDPDADAAEESTRLAESVLDCTTDIAKEVLRLLEPEDADARDSLAGRLMALAIFGGPSLSGASFARLGISGPTVARLAELGFMSCSAAGDVAIHGALRYHLRERAAVLLRFPAERDKVEPIWVGFIEALSDPQDAEQEKELESCAERGFSWFRGVVGLASAPVKLGPEYGPLWGRLLHIVIQSSLESIVPPLAEDEIEQALRSLTGEPAHRDPNARLNLALSRLIVAIRFELSPLVWIERFKEATDAVLKQNAPLLWHVNLLDKAGVLCARATEALEELLDARTALALRIGSWTAGWRNPGSLRCRCSWLLNTASLYFRRNRKPEGQRFLAEAQGMLEGSERAGQGGAVWGSSLRLQLLGLQAQGAEGQAVLDFRRRAAEEARYAPVKPDRLGQWSASVLATHRQLILDIPIGRTREAKKANDQEKIATYRWVIQGFNARFGEPRLWPLVRLAQTASLLRLCANRMSSVSSRIEVLNEAINLLKDFVDISLEVAKQGDPRPLLALARCYFDRAYARSWGQEEKAAREDREYAFMLCMDALRGCTTSSGLKLASELYRSLADNSLSSLDSEPKDVTVGFRSLARSSTWQSWLDAAENKSCDSGRSAVQLLELRWRHNKDMWDAAKERAQSKAKEWEKNSLVRWEFINAVYKQRLSELDRVKRDWGPSVEASLAELSLSARFTQLHARNFSKDRQEDTSSTRGIFERAMELWPEDERLIVWQGRQFYHRWEYPSAIVAFRDVTSRTQNPLRARRYDLLLVKAILKLLTNQAKPEPVAFPGGCAQTPEALLAEADEALERVVEYGASSVEVMIFREQIRFEQGHRIDWARMEKIWREALGGADAYVQSVTENVQTPSRSPPSRSPPSKRLTVSDQTIDEAARANPTNIDMFSAMATLFRRRVEHGMENPDISDDLLMDCVRSYAAYDACRVLEDSGEARTEIKKFKGSPRSCFSRARVILWASTIVRNRDPFDAYKDEKTDLFQFAKSLIDSASARSVGRFYQKIKELELYANELGKTI